MLRSRTNISLQVPLSCRHNVHFPVLQVCWTRSPAACSCQIATCWQPACSPSTLRPAHYSTRCRGSASSRWLLLSCPEDWTTRPSTSWVALTTCRRVGSARDFALTRSTRGTRMPTPVRGCGLPSSCWAPPTCHTGDGGPSLTSPAPSVVGCSPTVCLYRHLPNTGEYSYSGLLTTLSVAQTLVRRIFLEKICKEAVVAWCKALF
jgi:hypothetical protein